MGYTTCDLGLSRHAWFFPPNYGHIRFWAISGLNHPKTWGFTLQKHVWPPKKWVSTSFIIRVFHTKLEDIQKKYSKQNMRKIVLTKSKQIEDILCCQRVLREQVSRIFPDLLWEGDEKVTKRVGTNRSEDIGIGVQTDHQIQGKSLK